MQQSDSSSTHFFASEVSGGVMVAYTPACGGCGESSSTFELFLYGVSHGPGGLCTKCSQHYTRNNTSFDFDFFYFRVTLRLQLGLHDTSECSSQLTCYLSSVPKLHYLKCDSVSLICNKGLLLLVSLNCIWSETVSTLIIPF